MSTQPIDTSKNPSLDRELTTPNLSIDPRSEIGQHLLLDEEVLHHICSLVQTGVTVVEIGAGPGTLTRDLITTGNPIIAYEIDERYEPFLTPLGESTKLVVRWQNFLDEPEEQFRLLGDYQIVGNIPYHISEPLMHKLSKLDFASAVLLVGKRLADTLGLKNPESHSWSRMSLIANAYFRVERLREVPRTSFYPIPRADGALIQLVPKDREGARTGDDTTAYIYRELVEADEYNSTVAKALKSVFLGRNGRLTGEKGKSESKRPHKTSRNEMRQALRRVADDFNSGRYRDDQALAVSPQLPESVLTIVARTVPQRILSRPLGGLNNSELRVLCSAISSAVNKRRELQTTDRE